MCAVLVSFPGMESGGEEDSNGSGGGGGLRRSGRTVAQHASGAESDGGASSDPSYAPAPGPPDPQGNYGVRERRRLRPKNNGALASFMENFDPGSSERERRKQQKKNFASQAAGTEHRH